MSTITIFDGDLVSKDPADAKIYVFDWDTYNLATAVTITTSTWTITPIFLPAAWSNGEVYEPGDTVLSADITYACILAHTNQVPPNVTYWAALGLPLTKDNDSVLAGSRKTQLRLTAGTLGQTYEIANKIRTSETPYQEKERSFRVRIEQR